MQMPGALAATLSSDQAGTFGEAPRSSDKQAIIYFAIHLSFIAAGVCCNSLNLARLISQNGLTLIKG